MGRSVTLQATLVWFVVEEGMSLSRSICLKCIVFLLVCSLGACSEDDAYVAPVADMMAQEDQGEEDVSADDVSPDVPDVQEDMGGLDLPEEDMGSPDVGPMDECVLEELERGEGLVATTQGWAQGRRAGEGWSFLQIPYVAPPVGELRWKPPQPAACWEGIRMADTWGPVCPQKEVGGVIGEEDCLHLNIWTPSDGTPDPSPGRPVMVFIHGGGNLVGSAVQSLGSGDAHTYDGRYLSARGDVVVVTLNYRLGALGFLAHPDLNAESPHGVSGNYASLDQIAALTWVKDNISAFGGDPSRVMVFGESAGSVNTCVMLSSPLAEGLFSSALMQSANCAARPLETVMQDGERAVSISGCGDTEDVVACMRELDALELVEGLPTAVGLGPGQPTGDERITLGLNYDGWVLPEHPNAIIASGEHNDVPLVIGSNSDEMASTTINRIMVNTEEEYEATVNLIFGLLVPDSTDRIVEAYPAADYESPNDALIQVLTDSFFTCGTRAQAALVTESQASPVYRYFFSRRPELRNGDGRAQHGIELVYVFGTLVDIPFYNPADGDLKVSEDMMDLWISVARDGQPMDSANWEAYEVERDNALEIAVPLATLEGVRTNKCDLWDGLFPPLLFE